jgi:plastocyanin
MATLRGWLGLVTIACGLVSCTPGASSAPNSGSATASIVVGESLLSYGLLASNFGTVGGFKPAIIVVASGTTIQFHNLDAFNHTASGIAAVSFPPGNPLPSTALHPSGGDVSVTGWSSGVLLPNAFSQTLNTAKPGTYLFGCFYHYPLMRGVIIVQ